MSCVGIWGNNVPGRVNRGCECLPKSGVWEEHWGECAERGEETWEVTEGPTYPGLRGCYKHIALYSVRWEQITSCCVGRRLHGTGGSKGTCKETSAIIEVRGG